MTSSQWSVKYRPENLKEFIGNDTAVKYILGLEKRAAIPNCLLVSGQSGVGKTTFARLAACRFSGWKGHPDKNPDIIELFANVERSIDDVREAIKQSRYSPAGGKRRCMIVDEAQGYAGPAASALLKACEEPPEKTTWILCTDQPEKLPRQLAMRAQQITLGSVSEEDLQKLCNWILKVEKQSLGSKQNAIVERICASAYGIPRQAVQLLDLVATSIIGGAQPSEALKMAIKTGSSTESFETALSLIRHLIAKNVDGAIIAIHSSNSEGVLELMLQILSSLIYKTMGKNPKTGIGWVAVKGYQGSLKLSELLNLQSRIINAVQLRMTSNYQISTESLLLSLINASS